MRVAPVRGVRMVAMWPLAVVVHVVTTEVTSMAMVCCEWRGEIHRNDHKSTGRGAGDSETILPALLLVARAQGAGRVTAPPV